MEWAALRKGVAYLFRYQEASWQANYRYLEASAIVDDPTPASPAKASFRDINDFPSETWTMSQGDRRSDSSHDTSHADSRFSPF